MNNRIQAMGVVLALGYTTTGIAQDDFRIDEIVVTAQKREQTLQQTPVAVTALGNEDIAQAEVRDIRDLRILAPSVGVTQAIGGYQTVLSVRGIGTSGFNYGLEPSVGLFIDGVYRSRTAVGTGDFLAVERIEVLRGPQSTLFGKNTSAGVVSIITQRPQFETGGAFEMTLGSQSRTIAKGTVTGPIIDDVLAYRVSGNYSKRDGFLNNQFDGRDVNDRDRISLRGQLLWHPTENVDVRLIGDVSDHDEICCAAPFFVLGPTAPAVTALGGIVVNPPDPFSRDVFFDGPLDSSADDFGLSLQVDWEGETLHFTSITGFREAEDRNSIDADFTTISVVSESSDVVDISSLTQEFRLASVGDNTVDWQVGGFYYDQKLDTFSKTLYGTDTRNFIDLQIIGATGMTGLLDTLEFLSGNPPGTFYAPGTGIVRENYKSTSDSYAVFGQIDWHLNDAFTITAGLRYTDEDKHGEGDFVVVDPLAALDLATFLGGAFAGLQSVQFFPPLANFNNDRNESEVTGNIIFAWDINDAINTYASYSRGYKAGGFNLSATAGGPNPTFAFDPEFADNYEFGLKSSFMDGQLQINTALFYEEISDFQTTLFNGISFDINNAGSIEITGLEIESRYRPNEYFDWVFSGLFMDHQYGSFDSSPCPIGLRNQGMFVCDLSGRNTGVTETRVSTYATLQRPMTGNMDWFVRGEVIYLGDRVALGNLDPNTEIDATTELNARIGIRQVDGDWEVALWGKNLNDEEFPQSMFDSIAQNSSFNGYPNDPRTYGITARFYF